MTSLLLPAFDGALGQKSECERTRAFWEPTAAGISSRLIFFPPFSFFYWDHKLNLHPEAIWIYGCIFTDLFAAVIWTTNWSHMKNKGTKQKSKKKGSDDAFGCNLIEHLQSSGQDGKGFFFLLLEKSLLCPSPEVSQTFRHVPPNSFSTPVEDNIPTYYYYCYYNVSDDHHVVDRRQRKSQRECYVTNNDFVLNSSHTHNLLQCMCFTLNASIHFCHSGNK